jgi:hypothetical protein
LADRRHPQALTADARVCHWLTLAVPDRAVLAPLRELGAELEPADHPRLPEHAADLRLFLVTLDGCSCKLMRVELRDALARALATVAVAAPAVLAHRTFGDPPRGRRAVGALEAHDVAAFVADEHATGDRWVRLVVPFAAGAPLPRWIDGARVLAVAPADRGGVAALVHHAHVPGVTLLHCDERWHVRDSRWHDDRAAARRDAHTRLGATAWTDADPESANA